MWVADEGTARVGGEHGRAQVVGVASGPGWQVSVVGEERKKVPKVGFDPVLGFARVTVRGRTDAAFVVRFIKA